MVLAPALVVSGVVKSMPVAGAVASKTPQRTSLEQAEEACIGVTDPDACVAKTSLGVHGCAYCAIDQECHAVGSHYNPCPNECCASQSHASSCKHRTPEEIEAYHDGTCEAQGNQTNSTPFYPKQVMTYHSYAAATYCDPATLSNWSCTPCTAMGKPSGVTVIDDKASGNLAVVSSFEDGSRGIRTIIAFRGTRENCIKNWIANFGIVRKAPYLDLPLVQVHSGFYNAYSDLHADILSAIAKLPPLPIILTGHSLGAALATICAFELHRAGLSVDRVFTFGSPRVGNFEFHDAFMAAIPTSWRLTHNRDTVPHLPQQNLGFYHTITEVFYPTDTDKGYTICDSSGEDLNCSNRCSIDYACTSIDDHFLYLGKTIVEACL